MIIIRKFPMYTYGKIGPLYTMRTAPNALQRLRGAAARRRGEILRPGGRASPPHVEAVDLSGRTPKPRRTRITFRCSCSVASRTRKPG